MVGRIETGSSVPYTTRDHGHGHGRDEYRTLRALPIGPDDPDISFPGAKQIGQIVRDTTLHTGATRGEVVQFITSLDQTQASPERLAQLIRGHWGIENRSHWRRDVVFGEDRCRTRTRHAPINLAALRNLTCSILAKHRPRRFDRLRNALAGSLPGILAILTLGPAVVLGYF